MSLDGDGDSFDAVKKALLVQQRAQYEGLSLAQEQRRLRIHLRRVLLLSRAAPARSASPQGYDRRSPCSSAELWEWKRAAIDRDEKRRRRHASATVIQRLAKRWLAALGDVELLSTSELVPVDVVQNSRAIGHQVEPNSRHYPEVVSHEEETVPPDSLPSIAGSFQVIIELLGARDLFVGHHCSMFTVTATVRVVHQSSNEVLGWLEAPEVAVDMSNSEGIQWDGQVLQVGLDEEQLPAEKFLQECSVAVDVCTPGDDGSTTPLGRLSVAMDLLVTPLAENYAMTRWFPLEKSRSGGTRPVRGEVRLCIRFLMWNPKRNRAEDDLWVPYVSSKPAGPPAQMTRRPGTKRTLPGRPPLSPRNALSPQVSSLRTRKASPPRHARVEAMSPPSSPSSYSSDSNARESELSPLKATSLSPPRSNSPFPRQLSGGIVGATTNAKRASAVTSGDEVKPGRGQLASEDSPKKLFLKRKPCKVVFQKLDWSRVTSKTDSNLGSGAKSGKSAAASPRRASGTSVLSPAKPKSAIDEKLARVADQVYAACTVTAQSAGLAQMRFKAERKRWLPPSRSFDREESSASDDAREQHLHALWQELQQDADGTRYVALLTGGTISRS